MIDSIKFEFLLDFAPPVMNLPLLVFEDDETVDD